MSLLSHVDLCIRCQPEIAHRCEEGRCRPWQRHRQMNARNLVRNLGAMALPGVAEMGAIDGNT